MTNNVKSLDNARIAARLESLLASVEGLANYMVDPERRARFEEKAARIRRQIAALREEAHAH
jgi:superfamily II RNA helicase